MKELIMKNIIDLYEASILDIEGNLSVVDKINDQFETIKSLITDPDKYSKINRHSNMFLEIKNVEDILSFVGLNKQTSLIVSITKRNEYVGWGAYENFWNFNILIKDDKDIEFKTGARGLSFPKFLKKYIEPHFKDLESFIKFIKRKS